VGEAVSAKYVGLAEAARILGVKKQNVRSLAALPKPEELMAGPIWKRTVIEAFAEERKARA
jgi:hypothetical protein